MKVNGQLMDFTLELGSFGSAFFAHEQEQEVSPAAGDTQTQGVHSAYYPHLHLVANSTVATVP